MSEQASPADAQAIVENWPIGWLVEEETGTDPVLTHQLVLAFYGQTEDELLFSQCVWSSTRSDARAMGDKARAWHLWQAIARYMNAGGELWQLSNVLGELPTTIPKIEIPDFYLLNTEQEPQFVEHAFINYASSHVLIWEEGESVSLVSASEYRDELLAEEQSLDEDDEFGDPWET